MEPTIGKVYRHYKGGRYRVTDIVECVHTHQRLVIYRSLQDDRVWARRLSDWVTETDGGSVRFMEEPE